MLRKLVLAFCIITTFTSISSAGIVADHTAVEQFDQIPDYYINEVKKMWLSVPGQSHSRGYRWGIELLAAQDPRFAAVVTEAGEPELPTTDHLRMSNLFRTPEGGWGGTAGEEMFWTTQGAVDYMNNHLTYSNSVANPVSAFGFGWCWDMTWDYGHSEQIDEVHGVRWYGTANTTNGWGTSQNWWGIDTADNFDGNHPITLQNYLNAIEYYNTHNPQTVTFYTTGPVDGGGNTGERGYQRYIKHQAIRNHVYAGEERVLFDYADILTHNSSGEQNFREWDGHTFPFIHDDNADTSSHDHISDEGAVRIAKAMWWMLARIAGWDGVAEDKVATPIVSLPTGDYEDSVTITITEPTEDAVIYYTLDGSEPTEESQQYSEPLLLQQSTTLKAKAFKDGIESSETLTAVYNIIIDVTPPQISSIEATSATEIVIEFNEGMNTDSLAVTENYTINNGISVLSATPFAAPFNGVTLQVTDMVEDTTYTVIINGVSDDHNNQIAVNSSAEFTYTVVHAPESLQQHWSFETAADIQVNGAVQVENGRSGKAFYFDGDDYLILGNATHNIEQTNAFTIATWIKYEDALSGDIISRGQYVFPYRMTTSGSYMRSVIRTGSTNYVRGTLPLTEGVWNYVVLTYKDGERAMYLNGEVDYTDAISGQLNFNGSQDIFIGQGFKGTIDEIQIYNEALAPEQIQLLYAEDIPQYVQNPQFSPIAGTYNSTVNVTLSSDTEDALIYYTLDGSEPDQESTLYTAPFAVSASTSVKAKAYKNDMVASATVMADYIIELDEIPPQITGVETVSETELIIRFSEEIEHNSLTNSANYSISGVSIDFVSAYSGSAAIIHTSGFTANTPYLVGVNNIEDQAGNTIAAGTIAEFTYVTTEPPQGLQQYWDFESSDGITVVGATHVDNGKSGKAFYFDGVDDRLELGTDIYGITDTNEFTISAWINYESSLSGNIIARGRYVYPYCMTTSGSYMRSIIRTDRTNYIRGTLALAGEEWHHVVLTYRDGERVMYVDGEIDHQSEVTGTLNAINDSQIITVGQGFHGLIDEIKIYNSVLTPAQVTELYNENIIPQVAVPQIDPAAGTYNQAIEVIISSTTADATIYYTTDGSEPGDSATLYQGVFILSENATVKAIAYKDGMETSEIVSVSYQFEIDSTAPQVSVVTVNNATTLTVEFNEELDLTTAQDSTNYTIASGLIVSSARLDADGKTVVLTTMPLPENIEQILQISGVADINGNVITAPVTAAITYVPVSVDDSVTGYWSFDAVADNEVPDLSGNSNNGTINGTEIIAEGMSGSAISFNGENSVDLGVSRFGIEETSEYSISIWFKPEQTFAGHLIRRGPYVYPYRIYANAGRVSSTVRTTGTNYLHANTWPDAETWYHCLVTYKDGEHRIYINGVLDSSDADTGAPNFYGNYSTMLGEGYSGLIDEVKIFNKSLNQEEVTAVYQQVP
ncbi:MAG: hypothetical protein D6B27_01075 [Gammaproteobacteria bacterium]|nr:MAG: hypothetical protein D6B27_01075 [Gammaproteobacteria bacterium]